MSVRPDPEELYDRLRDEGMFEEAAEDLRFTDEFVRNRERCRETVDGFDDDAYAERVAEYTAAEGLSAEEIDEPTLADAMAIRETCETVDPATSVYVARSLERTETADEDPNLPRGFVALSGEELGPFIEAQPASIIYCWREDCEPCAAVREDLEALRREGAIPERVGLGAVYGPDNVDVLREEYEVGAAPTVLFCSEGTIESRFVGNPGTDGIRREIDILAEGLEDESET